MKYQLEFVKENIRHCRMIALCFAPMREKGSIAMCKSEVALLRQQIALEIESMRLGIEGVASGTSRHAFISARMERIGGYQRTLAHHIGPDAANLTIGQLYMQEMEMGPSEAAMP